MTSTAAFGILAGLSLTATLIFLGAAIGDLVVARRLSLTGEVWRTRRDQLLASALGLVFFTAVTVWFGLAAEGVLA